MNASKNLKNILKNVHYNVPFFYPNIDPLLLITLNIIGINTYTITITMYDSK